MFGLMELGILPTIVLQIEEQWHTYGGVRIQVIATPPFSAEKGVVAIRVVVTQYTHFQLPIASVQ